MPSSVISLHKGTTYYAVFIELHKINYYITEGIKYGSDFLLYEIDPAVCHAKYMVFILEGTEDKITTNQMVMFERIAESNKKVAVVAWVKSGIVSLVSISQFHLIDNE